MADINHVAKRKSAISYRPDELNGNAPLTTAAAHGYIEIVRLLISRGAHICPSSGGHTNPHNLKGGPPDLASRIPMLAAIKNGHEEIVKILFAKDRVRKDQYLEYVGYLAYFSIITKKDNIALFFLKKGAQTDYEEPYYYHTGGYNDRRDLLQLAKEFKCIKVLRFFEEQGIKS